MSELDLPSIDSETVFPRTLDRYRRDVFHGHNAVKRINQKKRKKGVTSRAWSIGRPCNYLIIMFHSFRNLTRWSANQRCDAQSATRDTRREGSVHPPSFSSRNRVGWEGWVHWCTPDSMRTELSTLSTTNPPCPPQFLRLIVVKTWNVTLLQWNPNQHPIRQRHSWLWHDPESFFVYRVSDA